MNADLSIHRMAFREAETLGLAQVLVAKKRQELELRLLRERVKGIIWLNPEGQWGWGIGDSVMPMYAPACDFVKECRTIGQLGEVVDNLVHHWWRRGR